MSCKRNRKISTCLFIVMLTFYNLHLSFSLSEDIKLKTLFGLPASRDKVESEYHLKAGPALRHRVSALPQPARSALPEQRSKVAGLSPPALDRAAVRHQLADPADTYEQRASEVTIQFGNGSERTQLRNTKGSDRYLSYQADYPGFQEIHEANIFGPSFDDSRPTPSSEWQAKRPLVQCHDTTMILMASGEDFAPLFVEREGDFPISVFDLPPNCGYSVKASRNGLVVEAPYVGCYMTKQNGSYVLPMLWWDIPLRLSCPMQKTPPSPPLTLSVPRALCSPYGVAVHVYGTDEEIPALGTIVKDNWEPLVSPKCAYRTEAPLGNLLFYIPLNAPCLQTQEGLYLRVLKDDQEFSLSCQDPSSLLPLVPIPPHTPPLSPVDPQHPHPPDPITPAPLPTIASPPPPQSMTQGQVIWPPGLLNYPHPGPPFPHLPLVYPPGSQPKSPPQPSPDVAPGPPPQFPHIYSGPGQQQFSPHPPPSPPQQPAVAQTSGPSVDPVNQYPKWPPQQGFYHGYEPYMPLYGSNVPRRAPVPSTQSTTAPPPNTPPHTPHVAPNEQQFNPQQLHTFSQVPQSPESPAFPALPQQLLVPQQPLPYSQYYPYWSMFTPGSVSDGSTPAPSQPPTTPTPTLRTMLSKQLSGPDQRPGASLCPPYAPPFCGYHPDAPYFPSPTAPPYPPQHTTPVTPGSHLFPSPAPLNSASKHVMFLRPQSPRIRCFSERMMAFLPSPHPDSIQVRASTVDFQKAWLHLSAVSPLCKFKLLRTKEPGLIFVSPIPACHSQRKTPTTLSLRLRYWDILQSRRRILEFQCPYRPPPTGTPAAEAPPIAQTTQAASLPPPTPLPGQAMPDLPQVAHPTRPGLGPHADPGQGCDIPQDQRLPCGTGALTQPQCLSLGCCFNMRPPACYYPMDECTLDHHFVFTVPASLTDPPLSPALLAAPGHLACTPQRVTADYALFLIPMDGCGARKMVVGKTVIYILEIFNRVESITLDYGTITRDSPARILVECRYKSGPPSVTTGYMTKIPSLGPGIPGQGVFGVQLRIAKDAQYNSFYPQYHLPLRMLLGQPLYLEVRLVNPPDPQLVLLVHYCVAYPRSGTAMWVLLYKECPNPLDPSPHNVVLPSPPGSQTRRFIITTFKFLQKGKTYELNQEVYFMCSTEACVSQAGPCVEGCVGQ